MPGRPTAPSRSRLPRFRSRSGLYLAVLREGIVEAGGPFDLLGEDPHHVSVDDIYRLFLGEQDGDVLARALKVEVLPEGWKVHLLRQSER
jgi:MOSC domain-containing protein YiiM